MPPEYDALSEAEKCIWLTEQKGQIEFSTRLYQLSLIVIVTFLSMAVMPNFNHYVLFAGLLWATATTLSWTGFVIGLRARRRYRTALGLPL